MTRLFSWLRKIYTFGSAIFLTIFWVLNHTLMNWKSTTNKIDMYEVIWCFGLNGSQIEMFSFLPLLIERLNYLHFRGSLHFWGHLYFSGWVGQTEGPKMLGLGKTCRYPFDLRNESNLKRIKTTSKEWRRPQKNEDNNKKMKMA